MAAGGAFGGSRGVKPVPPEKGVFPLDHFHECKPAMQEYMQCLKNNQMLADRCKHLSKKYLECRMERTSRSWDLARTMRFTPGETTIPSVAMVGYLLS
ncbi:cytochrome c oxidase assembly protein COX19 isoform X2 [Selaginella moellendorffii]|uniref:cytochrome c oxidase assembly protein COX19 isoform X2 n=1 Tax=Selaginella moellendorffii TaxID=88036 RepID=UPI000D1CED87|nr:cytochrome c oxidase assembly protein COX19 isoform X2 [Selaginella moellendorffii]|eukprot:XP_024545746.1 cytochrome c oxidase assembly protein COX19 isoform X2 [Selaginella moellendorffii]